MFEAPANTIVDHFSTLTDPQVERRKLHKLIDITTIAICGAVCGADDWVAVAGFGRAKEKWLRTFLELPNGIPSHDTFTDVFVALDPEEFQVCFRNWIKGVAEITEGEIIAIDGKTLRRSHDETLGKSAIHIGLPDDLWMTLCPSQGKAILMGCRETVFGINKGIIECKSLTQSVLPLHVSFRKTIVTRLSCLMSPSIVKLHINAILTKLLTAIQPSAIIKTNINEYKRI